MNKMQLFKLFFGAEDTAERGAFESNKMLPNRNNINCRSNTGYLSRRNFIKVFYDAQNVLD